MYLRYVSSKCKQFVLFIRFQEHHLQRAICAGLLIPTPEVSTVDDDAFYNRVYPPDYKMPRQLIHMQRKKTFNLNSPKHNSDSHPPIFFLALGMDTDIPDYDMDAADEVWVDSQQRRLDLTPLKFEQMMDKLEKSSGQTVVTLNEAKALLKEDDDVSIAVFDYWLNKRLTTVRDSDLYCEQLMFMPFFCSKLH